MAEDSLEYAFAYYSERYGVCLSDSEKLEMVKNISGFFAVLHEWEVKSLKAKEKPNEPH